jgi:hypothetical protein
MPAFLTHKLAADDVLERLEGNPRITDVINANIPAYHSGAQGGDYYYLYKYYSMWAGHTYKMFGYALHRARPQRFFAEGAQYVKNHPDDMLIRSFFYGYITHYCLDYILHPQINAICPNAMNNHNTLEYGIDTVYAHEKGFEAMEFDRAKFVEETFVESDELNRFFDDCHKRLYYGFRLKPGSYHTTYRYFAEYNRKMFMPDEKQMKRIRLQNKFTMLDLLTMLYYPYEEVKDLFDYHHFLGLIEKSIEKSIEYIKLADGYLHGERSLDVLESAFYNVNFNGIPVVPREERKAFRRMYKKAKLRLF